MYVTSTNQCYALDAGTGRQIWHYSRPRTRGLIGNAAGGVNRGVAVAGDRVFMVTDHAHIIALNRATGALLWETEMADWRQNYNATGAPLVGRKSRDLRYAGGDEGVRGFLAAYDQATGKEVWRFWTVPAPGEPGSETWQGGGIAHPGAATWLTGTYDPELDTIYWPTGNPTPDLYRRRSQGRQPLLGFNRRARREDREAQVAFPVHAARRVGLRRAGDAGSHRRELAGTAEEAPRAGQPQRFLLRARSHRRKVSVWHEVRQERHVGHRPPAEGRPLRVPDMEPSLEGRRVCPSLEGASNWYSTSFNPATGLYYVQTNDKCGVFTKIPMEWAAGRGYMGGSFVQAPDEPAQRVLRAIDIQTGKDCVGTAADRSRHFMGRRARAQPAES